MGYEIIVHNRSVAWQQHNRELGKERQNASA